MSTTTASRFNGTASTVVLSPDRAAQVAETIRAMLESRLESERVEIASKNELTSHLGEMQADAEVFGDWLDQLAWGESEHDVTPELTPLDWAHLVASLFERGRDGLRWVNDEERAQDGLAAVTPMREDAAWIATAVAILDQLEVTR